MALENETVLVAGSVLFNVFLSIISISATMMSMVHTPFNSALC